MKTYFKGSGNRFSEKRFKLKFSQLTTFYENYNISFQLFFLRSSSSLKLNVNWHFWVENSCFKRLSIVYRLMFFIEVVTCAWTHQIYLLPLHIPFLSPPATSMKRPIRVNLKLPPHNWNFIVKSVYTRRHFEGVDLFGKEHLAWVKIDVLIDCFLFYTYSTSFSSSSASFSHHPQSIRSSLASP